MSRKKKASEKASLPFTESQIQVASRVAIRVSDKENCKVLTGIPRTDCKTIYLPFDDPSLNYEDLEGIASHEGGHIRFKSVIDPKMYEAICPEDPRFGCNLLNVCEDFRINIILHDTFPGFWEELNTCNIRLVTKSVDDLIKEEPNIMNTYGCIRVLMWIIMCYSIESPELLNNDRLKNDQCSFKFSNEPLKLFIESLGKIFSNLKKERSYLASVVAAKEIYSIILAYFLAMKIDFPPQKEQDLPKTLDSNSGEVIENKSETSDKLSKKKSKKPKPENAESMEDEDEDEVDFDSDLDIDFNEIMNQLGSDNYDDSESGIPIQNLTAKSKASLQKLRKLIKKPLQKGQIEKILNDNFAIDIDSLIKSDSKEIGLSKKDQQKIDELNQELTNAHEEINDILDEIKNPEFKYSDKTISHSLNETHEIKEGLKQITVNTYRDSEQLRRMNQISNPTSIYESVTHKYRTLIHSLQIKFLPIKQSTGLQRGYRRGYVSCRDLPQVRITRGQYNRAFKFMDRSVGAHLVLLIDESGSMMNGSIDIARTAAIILAEALKGTKIEFSIIGFGAQQSRYIICEKIYKDFIEPLRSDKLGAINVANTYMENRDGTSIRQVVDLHLHSMQNYIPILIIISDGEPYHGGTSYIGKSAIHDTGSAIHDVQQKGVSVFALSIDHSGSYYLPDIYGKHKYTIIQKIENLPNQLVSLVSDIAEVLSR